MSAAVATFRQLLERHAAPVNAAMAYLDRTATATGAPLVLFVVHDSHAEFAALLSSHDDGEEYPRLVGGDVLLMPAFVPDAVKLLVEMGHPRVAARIADEYDALPAGCFFAVGLVAEECVRGVFERAARGPGDRPN